MRFCFSKPSRVQLMRFGMHVTHRNVQSKQQLGGSRKNKMPKRTAHLEAVPDFENNNSCSRLWNSFDHGGNFIISKVYQVSNSQKWAKISHQSLTPMAKLQGVKQPSPQQKNPHKTPSLGYFFGTASPCNPAGPRWFGDPHLWALASAFWLGDSGSWLMTELGLRWWQLGCGQWAVFLGPVEREGYDICVYIYIICMISYWWSFFFKILFIFGKGGFSAVGFVETQLDRVAISNQVHGWFTAFFGIFSIIVNHQHHTIFWNSNSNHKGFWVHLDSCHFVIIPVPLKFKML